MAARSSITTITLLDDVEKCEKEVIESLLALSNGRPVKIVINSGGGSVYAGLGIATVIKMKQLRAQAIVLADCSSSALLVFAACESRLVAPHASFLFHPMKWSSEDAARLSGAQSWATEFTRVSDLTEDWLVEHLGASRRTIRRWIREEKYVQAADLFRLGIAEEMDLEQEGVIDISRRAKTTRAKAPARRIRKAG